MSKAIRVLAIVLMGSVSVAACTSQQPSAPKASAPSTTKPPQPTTTIVAPATATSTAPTPCVGLSICPPPPPDADGNPGCYYADGWQGSGAGIEVWYFHEPQNISKPDKVTAVVRKKDGTNESQDANIDAGQQVHRFEFPTIDKSAVQEVLLTSSTGRCFVIGPGT
jgi:hypothetical protein